jgi:hypothetical protein
VDTASLAAGLAAARMGQVQLAVAGKMLKMNADQAQSVVKLLDAAQGNLDSLAKMASGVGTRLDITV